MLEEKIRAHKSARRTYKDLATREHGRRDSMHGPPEMRGSGEPMCACRLFYTIQEGTQEMLHFSKLQYRECNIFYGHFYTGGAGTEASRGHTMAGSNQDFKNIDPFFLVCVQLPAHISCLYNMVRCTEHKGCHVACTRQSFQSRVRVFLVTGVAGI